MNPLDKIQLLDMRQQLKSAKMRSLCPVFTQIIELARKENFTDEEIAVSFSESLSDLGASQYLIGALLGAISLSKSREKG